MIARRVVKELIFMLITVTTIIQSLSVVVENDDPFHYSPHSHHIFSKLTSLSLDFY